MRTCLSTVRAPPAPGLGDPGESYAVRMRDAGVPTSLRREPGMVHDVMLRDLVSPAWAGD